MKIRIFVGTGGVGKTSVAAAASIKAALGGRRCLVLTIDPALRLRTTLGLESKGSGQRVPLDSLSPRGELWAMLMDVRTTLDRAVYSQARGDQAKTIIEHPVYQLLITSLAGMQELLAIERINQAMADGFDTMFIDTAPARHAFEFLDKPEFFAQLVSLPLIRLVGRTYRWWERTAFSSVGRRTLELYTRVEEILGATLVKQVLDFYSVFRGIAEAYAERAKSSISLLRDPRVTSFTIVTTPFKSLRDADFFLRELSRRNFPVDSLVVNRVWPALDLEPVVPLSPSAREAAEWYRDVSLSHRRMWERVCSEFSGRVPKLVEVSELSGDVEGLAGLCRIAEMLDLALC